MAFFLYASFPNSRNKARNATVNANTYLVTVGPTTAPITLIAAANENRTYIILSNTSNSLNLRYLYPVTLPGVNPTVTPTFGVLHQTLYDPTGNLLYQKQDDGRNTNWLLVTPSQVAEVVLPFQNASLETLGDIYAFTDDPAASIIVAVDEGRG